MDPWDGVIDTNEKPNTCVQIKDTMFPDFSGKLSILNNKNNYIILQHVSPSVSQSRL